MAKVILVYAEMQDGGDYAKDYIGVTFEVIDEKKLEDINVLMREYCIKKWLDNPDFDKIDEWKEGEGALLEYRAFTVKPIKVVKSWQLIRSAQH